MAADRIFTIFSRYQIARDSFARAWAITTAQSPLKVFLPVGLLSREGYAGLEAAWVGIAMSEYWALIPSRPRRSSNRRQFKISKLFQQNGN